MENEIRNFIGIDISKTTFDVALIKNGDKSNILSKQFENNKSGFNEFAAWLTLELGALDVQTLFCMEYTGIYNYLLCDFLLGLNVRICIETALNIIHSLGMLRGKNDKVDAVRIANYASKNAADLRIWNKSQEGIIQLKHFLGTRDRLIKSKVVLETPVNELREIGINRTANMLHNVQYKVIRELKKSIAEVEKHIQEVIESDQEIKKNFDRITSIPGIGKINAWHWLCVSQNFTRFSNAKQMACFCGVAPFERTSGSSIRGKARVSSLANKTLKKLLHMAAMSAIQSDQELKIYYQCKVESGKNKMSVMNAVRNKLAHRIFAVIRDQRNYEYRPAA